MLQALLVFSVFTFMVIFSFTLSVMIVAEFTGNKSPLDESLLIF